MTIRELVRGRSTLDQLEIFQRADRSSLPLGRFFGGQLSDEQIDVLTKGLKEHGQVRPVSQGLQPS